ncbi:PTS system glucose-specific IIA component [Breznakia blatticola]|uniref:PTS system glucose-specific IIA component n=1 Tax=Breznakia blatticola TaxID=1754012 RepID=A0A4R7ZJ37_9FIRM|nr:PTS glucose transporter subunit IIA [Breznakia blatticola]TDW16451.1 PTS system glucose-specific IIA component [Breznakia blatticola]
MLFKRSQKNEIYAPVDGIYVKQELINDPTYATTIMGVGCGVRPANNIVKSPVDGEIMMVFPTGHAVGLKRKDGVEILIHIGIDTVNLQGKGFTTLVKQGDKVNVGAELVRFDQEIIKQNDLDPTVIVIFTNTNGHEITLHNESESITTRDVIADVK